MSRNPGLPKTGGRSAGTPNKRSLEARQRIEELGFDPIEGLVLIARGDWEKLGYKSETYFKPTGESSGYEEHFISPEMRLSATKELCAYSFPKLKAIEHSVDPDSPPFLGPVTPELMMAMVEAARKAKEKPQGDAE